MSDVQPTFSVQNLDFYYGPSKALSQINLEIQPRKVTALIGPSGCGKSTFLRCLNRMNDTISGTRVTGNILLNGQDIYAEDMDVVTLRQRVGMVFQKPNPFPKSIYENVAYGPRVHGVKDKAELDRIVEQSLRHAALWDEVKDRLHSPAAKLSIGQQQRLALARVLSIEPEIILADEPTSALDPISAKLVETQFKILKENYTIIFVTHILRQAKRLADYIIFLYMGDLIEHEPAGQFFSEPRDEKTKAYITGEIS